MGKKSNAKKSSNKGGPAPKLVPQMRAELSAVVEQLFKLCTKVPSATAPSAAQEWAEYLDMHQLVQKILHIEREIVLPRYNREDQIELFLKWLKEKGFEVNGVEIKNFVELGLGLCATRDLTLSEQLIVVPESAMMSEDTARSSYLGDLIKRDPILQHMGNISLSLHVLGECANPQSAWQPYLRMLPATYDTTHYFTPDQVHGLKGSPALDEAIKQFRNISRQYSYFYRIFRTAPEAKSWPIRDYFSFDAYRWAVSTIMTRGNRIPAATGSGQLALIPAWDMANHEQGIYSTDYESEKKQMVCLAHRDFKCGEQVTIFYGQRSNNELFLHNGFVQTGNEYDSLSIKLGVSKNDPLYESKCALLSSLGIHASGAFMLVPGPHPISSGLLAFTRIFSMEKDSLSKWQDDGDKAKDLLHEDCDVGTDVQDKTWKFLHIRVQLLKRAYPTTLQEDEEVVNSLCGPQRLIKSYLIAEKKILNDAENFLASHIGTKG